MIKIWVKMIDSPAVRLDYRVHCIVCKLFSEDPQQKLPWGTLRNTQVGQPVHADGCCATRLQGLWGVCTNSVTFFRPLALYEPHHQAIQLSPGSSPARCVNAFVLPASWPPLHLRYALCVNPTSLRRGGNLEYKTSLGLWRQASLQLGSNHTVCIQPQVPAWQLMTVTATHPRVDC